MQLLHKRKLYFYTGTIHNVGLCFQGKEKKCGVSAFVHPALLRPFVRRRQGLIPSPRWLQTRRTSRKGGVRPWNLLGFCVLTSVPGSAGAQVLRRRCLVRTHWSRKPETNRRRLVKNLGLEVSKTFVLGFRNGRPRTERWGSMLQDATSRIGTGSALVTCGKTSSLYKCFFKITFCREICNTISTVPFRYVVIVNIYCAAENYFYSFITVVHFYKSQPTLLWLLLSTLQKLFW